MRANPNVNRIDYSTKFLKQLKKAPLSIRIAFRKRLAFFIQDQSHPLLNNHSLTGNLKGYRSINITGDWRAIFSEYEDEEGKKVVVFEMLGTHSELYK
ncbi:type II toxin-antitoxin system mRNA interferase toxin, RelE/StbE family [Candidatus Roizmanbacteria bacterium]|nr:type II toxin-antitoxin system mRNA interferase toxin, RelE/StbE family [Candidatus Roizmanbacteria bacterium]